ncbi:hypothetical protein BZG36_01993 [Bifiguratus adelaidae]|uniref:PQ-loop-domain-containing protein n=1 Tax=Bifiguratus adelaidae TaxID=1938954 RepID=A0A261Y451_9FUNG|nr:hypothetical protein BZG36_01993 [Bifiguratus adelaidae]
MVRGLSAEAMLEAMLEALADRAFWPAATGYISIACWIVVFSPQLWENYKRKSGEGLSIPFLIIWLSGDIFNLVGVVLQDLLFTMLFLAIYYTFADVGLLFQVLYYRRYGVDADYDPIPPDEDDHHPKATTSLLADASSVHPSDTSQPSTSSKKPPTLERPVKTARSAAVYGAYVLAIIITALILLYGFVNILKGDTQPPQPASVLASSHELKLVPQVAGYLSAACYLGSRVPQIYKNWHEKSTEGLSFAMFGFSVLGNVTYCLSIFLDSMEPSYILMNLPWIAGSGGTLVFDFIASMR